MLSEGLSLQVFPLPHHFLKYVIYLFRALQSFVRNHLFISLTQLLQSASAVAFPCQLLPFILFNFCQLDLASCVGSLVFLFFWTSASWDRLITFLSMLGKFSAIIPSQIFSGVLFLFLPSNSCNANVPVFNAVPEVSQLSSPFRYSFSQLRPSRVKDSIILASQSLHLSLYLSYPAERHSSIVIHLVCLFCSYSFGSTLASLTCL